MKIIQSGLLRSALVLAVFLCGSSPMWGQNPSPLEGLLGEAAKSTSFGNSQRLLAIFLTKEGQVLNVAADQVRKGPSTTQQSGATAEASGTTTLVEKPGIPELLNLALETGAVTQTTSGTSFTLQTTPYLLYSRFGARDTAETWDKLPALRRIGISATFNGSATSDATSNNFEKGEVKYAWGNRSPRDKAFRDKLQPILTATMDALVSRATEQLRIFVNGLTPKAQEAFIEAQIQFDTWRQAQENEIPAEVVRAKVQKLVEPIVSQLRDEDRAHLSVLLQALGNEQKSLANASKLLNDEAEAYLNAPHPQFSLAYSLLRNPVDSETDNARLSQLKAIVGYDTGENLAFNLDLEALFNNNRAGTGSQRLDRVRSYSASADLTIGKFAQNLADFTLGAKLIRPEGEPRQSVSAQAKINLYMMRGITIPLALTYSNRTENSEKSVVRFNVGLSMNGDSLLGLARNNS